MAARLFFFIIFFPIFILTGKAAFAQQKKDTVTVETHNDDSSKVNTEDTALIKKENTVIIKAKDSGTISKKSSKRDSSIEKRFNPKVATLRSAILPGWGQFYNKKYWKIPIIYGALGITAGVFFYNLKTYKLLRQAVVYRASGTAADSMRVAAEFRDLPTDFLRQNRNIFRQNIDYSVLVFLGFWVLNIVDADVDANLKAFDVSPDIGMRIQPGFNNNSFNPGVSLVFFFKERSNKPSMPLP